MIFNQIQKFQRNKSRQAPAQPQRNLPPQKNQKPVEEEYIEEDIPMEDDFVEPINK